MAAPPLPPPPPPPPPPLASAPAPWNDPFASPEQGLNANMEPQSISSPSSEEKIWERSWTVEELRKGSSNWTLAADAGLLHYLQEFSQKMISQTHEIETQVDGLVISTKGMDSKVQNTMNDFLMLSNAQFIENRVYEEDVSKDENSEEKEKTDEPEKAKTREQREAEVIPKISEALKHGISMMDNAFVKLELTTEQSDNEDEEDEDMKTNFAPQVILEPKDVYANRPLPHLIGTSDFFRDELVGLGESSGEEDEEEDQTSDSESETESSESEVSKSETSESSESETEETKGPEKKQKQKAKAIESADEDDDDLFGEKKKKVSSSEDNESEEEEETPMKPKGGLDFASELAAKIGVAPVKHQHSNEEPADNAITRSETNDDEPPEAQTLASEKPQSETKSRSESKSKEKKSHHHHHDKKERSESHSGHKHRKRRDSKSSMTSVDTRQSSHTEEDLFGSSSPQEDGLFEGTGAPFGKKRGLFSGGGNLFDDVEEKDDLFAEEKSTEAKEKEQLEDEESVLIKPRARSTASGKKIPAGAVSIFGESGLFGSPAKEDLSITKQETQSQESETKAKVKKGSLGGLFHGDDDDDDDDDEGDLFSGKTSKPTSSVQESTKSKPSSKKVELFGDDNDEDGEDGDLFSEKPVAKKAVQAPNMEKAYSGVFSGPKAADRLAVTPAEVKSPLVSQPGKSSSGGGLFSDDDGDDGGGLFGAPVGKSQSKAEPKSRPKAKTTISLFDDDEQDDEQDFFAPSAVAKPTSGEAKKESTNEKPTGQLKGTKQALVQSSFDDDANDLFSSSAPKASPPPITAPKVEKKENTKTTSKMQSLFDAGDDEGMFGEAGDIFSASPDQRASEPVSSVSAASAPQVAQKPSLFSDEEEDLFRSASDGKPEVKEKKKQVEEIPKVRKPVGGVSMFGGVDLFGGKKPSFSEEKNEYMAGEPFEKKEDKPEKAATKPVVAKKGEDLIGNEEDEDELFSSKPKTTKPPVVQKKTKLSSDLFGDSSEDDLFSAPPKSPADVKPVKAPVSSETDVKPVKAPVSSETDVKPVKPIKPAGAVAMFGGVDLFGTGQSLETVKSKPQGPLGGDEDEENLFFSKPKVKSTEKPFPERSLPLPVPKVASSPTRPSGTRGVSPTKPGSGIEKLQKSLTFNPATLRPGASPPQRELESTAVSFEEPANVRTLDSANKERARIQVKRRPPTRQARRAAATTSASDVTLFGSAVDDETSASSRVSWGGFPSRGLETSELDSAVSRANTRVSDMNDDLFGFTSSKSSKFEKEEMPKTLDKRQDPPDGPALFLSNSDLLVNAKEETDLLSEVPSKKKEKLFSGSIGQNDLSSVNGDVKNKNAEQLVGVRTDETAGDLLASSSSSTKQTKLVAVAEAPTASISQMSSSLDDENPFSTGRDKMDANKSSEKSTTFETKPTAIKEGKIAKDVSPSLEENLFSASQGKKEITRDNKQEKLFSSPIGEDDLFATSASTKKAPKSSAEETAKRTASPLTDKTPAVKPNSVLDEDDDDLFSFKKAETRKPKRVVKPLGDDDLFGDSGNIFDDIPSKPKEKRKKKSATLTAAPKDDIFAEETPAGGGPTAEKTAKKTTTKTKKKTEKKTKVSIFDDEVPSIFDDPLNATSK